MPFSDGARLCAHVGERPPSPLREQELAPKLRDVPRPPTRLAIGVGLAFQIGDVISEGFLELDGGALARLTVAGGDPAGFNPSHATRLFDCRRGPVA